MTFDKELEFFLSKFSHELRNPLTTMYSIVQLIEFQHPEVKDFKHWSSLVYDIEYMEQLLLELSDFSKSERLQIAPFSLRELLEKSALSFAASISHTEVEFTSKIDVLVNQITGDKTKIQEVILNLLKNAFDACKPCGTIYLHAFLQDNFVVITIKDNGCGIAEENLSKIFDPFVTTKKKGEGTGLGLPICQHIVHAHNGTIEVASKEKEGTLFTVRFPLDFDASQIS